MSLLLLLGVPLAVMLWFWNKIVFFCQTRLIPWVRSRLGNNAADMLANLIAFLDKGATFVRRNIRQAYRWLCQNVFGMKSKYAQTGPNTVVITAETYVMDENGNFVKVTSTETAASDDVPAEVRKELLKYGGAAEIDDLNEMKNKIKARAAEEGIELETAA